MGPNLFETNEKCMRRQDVIDSWTFYKLDEFANSTWANGPRSRYTRYTGTVQYLGIPRKTYFYLFFGIFGVILIKYLGFWSK